MHPASALQLLCSLAGWGCCAYLARSNVLLRTALSAQRALTGQSRTPALTRVLPALPCAGDPLPRFRLTQLDGRLDPDGVVRPPPIV